ncbi:MAG: response regulator [Rhodocyclaceae bacterium]|nr:MAG: response regulator [Rhodocyclaceae bacterium]
MSALQHKVLVVDDDPVVGKSFNRVLSQKGYVVVTAGNAQEALSKVQEGEYDVVFTDIKMPGMSGIELAERLKVERPWTPVVIVTGFGTTANQDRAKAAGVSSFLQKPLSPEMIEDSMTKALLDAVPAVLPGLADAVKPEPEPVVQESHLKKVALFVAAPFIGLFYAAMLPFVGLGMLAYFGIKALKKNAAAMKVVSLIAAPFIGLAFIVTLPFVGTAMLAWFGVRALIKKAQTE